MTVIRLSGKGQCLSGQLAGYDRVMTRPPDETDPNFLIAPDNDPDNLATPAGLAEDLEEMMEEEGGTVSPDDLTRPV
jgi:hypothetical protein